MSAPERIWIDGAMVGPHFAAYSSPDDCLAPHRPYVLAPAAPPDGGPAFPVMWEYAANETGMSLRQYAAIKLRVPDSGTDWLDAMILQAKHDEFAGQALAGLMSNCDASGQAAWLPDPAAKTAYEVADAMLAARGGE